MTWGRFDGVDTFVNSFGKSPISVIPLDLEWLIDFSSDGVKREGGHRQTAIIRLSS